ENSGVEYEARYPLFAKAIRKKYPEIKIISDMQTYFPDTVIKDGDYDIVDYHCYGSPVVVRKIALTCGDDIPEKDKIYVGELAAKDCSGKGNLDGALAEAAFMLRMETRADKFVMGSFAPLFANVNDWKWPVNLIGFDNHRSYVIPSYHVQKLFAENKGDVTLATKVTAQEQVIEDALPIIRGGVGVSCGNGSKAEFKEIFVESQGQPASQVQYVTDAGWWKVADCKFQFGQETLICGGGMALAPGLKELTDYTVRLKFRRLEGDGPVGIIFRAEHPWNYFAVQFGDGTNKQHIIRRLFIGYPLQLAEVVGGIKNGRWYDVSVTIRGKTIRVLLDGKEIFNIKNSYGPEKLPSLCANAVKDEKTG
ncbi:MAG TPA: alpha-L-arabinofuranosidase C-terminal domain-containing protein, partial [Methylococcales bacterium]